ncbi:hypothetical protein BRARA_I01465 [Brassica rapa]|uniref:Uncharacterized protein n=1 Tax=Brassica campestris TaxID=3711 RepID=A0A397Y2C6_BRACM|nr:hypothetical protein BRARA_I01465 [Brassica rapa]RID44686.1 hypothetical protein BRARA_I01465 [Brassica rapa]
MWLQLVEIVRNTLVSAYAFVSNRCSSRMKCLIMFEIVTIFRLNQSNLESIGSLPPTSHDLGPN